MQYQGDVDMINKMYFDSRVYTAAFCWYLQGMTTADTADAKYLWIENLEKDKSNIESDQNKCQW